jgi:hypothetical protein
MLAPKNLLLLVGQAYHALQQPLQNRKHPKFISAYTKKHTPARHTWGT